MSRNVIRQTELSPKSKAYWVWLAFLGLIAAIGMGAVYHMEHEGHWVTGMNNQVVWGTPHVFAVFLIVAASGALNIASIASVFKKKFYKPLAPLSAVLAMALLAGGLAVLVLDLGRPDRLIVAMTHYNFKSIFSWNIILYNGFFVIVGLYLFTMLNRPQQKHSSAVGTFAFVWRLALTTGTGSIFGFLVARQGYDAAIMAPMFIIYSFAYGLAIFTLIGLALSAYAGRPWGDYILRRLAKLMIIFLAGAAYFVTVQHLTNLYATEHHAFERFLLMEGGIYTALFWIGQVGIGLALPMALLASPAKRSRAMIGFASILVIVGGFAQMYVTIIAGQAFPLLLFPGMEVTSGFGDAGVASYAPSIWEILLGLAGIAIALLILTVVSTGLRIMPESLEDRLVNPDWTPEDDVKDDEEVSEAVARAAS